MNLHHLRVPFALLLLLSLSACSGSSSSVSSESGSGSGSVSPPANTLFETPTSDATGGSIYGVWGGSLVDGGITFDTRWRFEADTITLATRCTLGDGRESGTVGVTARARVSEAEITFLESKRDEKDTGGVTCRVTAQPRTLSVCDEREGFERECFRREGTTLTIFGNPLERLELVKLSDE